MLRGIGVVSMTDEARDQGMAARVTDNHRAIAAAMPTRNNKYTLQRNPEAMKDDSIAVDRPRENADFVNLLQQQRATA